MAALFQRPFSEIGRAEIVVSIFDKEIGGKLPIEFGPILGRYIWDFLQFLHGDGFVAPTIAMISLLDIKGRQLPQPSNPRRPAGTFSYFDRDDLLLPEVQIDDFRKDGVESIRPALDVLWQAGGFAHYF